MILFITNQDGATQDNFAVAFHLEATASISLCGPLAVRQPLLYALQDNATHPFLAFCHGEQVGLIGNDDQPSIGLNDIDLLSGRNTFAYACHTGGTLGQTVSEAGGVWLGYAGPINALPSDPNTIDTFRKVVDFIASRFSNCTSLCLAQAFLQELSALADEEFEAAASLPVSFDKLHALRGISRRLRIWLPKRCEPVKHNEAFGDSVV